MLVKEKGGGGVAAGGLWNRGRRHDATGVVPFKSTESFISPSR